MSQNPETMQRGLMIFFYYVKKKGGKDFYTTKIKQNKTLHMQSHKTNGRLEKKHWATHLDQ